MGRHDRPSSYWKVKENLGASFPTDPVVPYALAENQLLGGSSRQVFDKCLLQGDSQGTQLRGRFELDALRTPAPFRALGLTPFSVVYRTYPIGLAPVAACAHTPVALTPALYGWRS